MKRPRILSQFFLQIQLCLALGISFQSWSEPILFKPKSHRALFKADFFSSEDNFDPQDGTFEKLGPGHYYKINSYHFEWDYLPSNRLAWRVGLRVNQGESSDGTFARKNSALADGFLGLQYYLRATPLKMKPEIMLVFSQQKIDPNTDDLIISEGAHEIKLGSWFQKKFLTLDHYAYLGVN
ncbi:MAG: hypothetical protein KDD35_09920, partial [Bdellovibrionales bacterium]|nr:hypothetical protein [Bdellovibrionales bacterium]